MQLLAILQGPLASAAARAGGCLGEHCACASVVFTPTQGEAKTSAASPGGPHGSCTGLDLRRESTKRNAHPWSPVSEEVMPEQHQQHGGFHGCPARSDWHFLIFKITSSMKSQHFTRLKARLFPLQVIRSHLRLLQKDNGYPNSITSCVGCFRCWWLHCD